MPSVEDWVNNPLGTIQTLFDKAKDNDSSKVKSYFGNKLSTEQSLSWECRFNQPWINKNIRRLSRRKKRAYQKMKESASKTESNTAYREIQKRNAKGVQEGI